MPRPICPPRRASRTRIAFASPTQETYYHKKTRCCPSGSVHRALSIGLCPSSSEPIELCPSGLLVVGEEVRGGAARVDREEGPSEEEEGQRQRGRQDAPLVERRRRDLADVLGGARPLAGALQAVLVRAAGTEEQVPRQLRVLPDGWPRAKVARNLVRVQNRVRLRRLHTERQPRTIRRGFGPGHPGRF